MSQFDWDDLRVFLALHRGRSVRSASRRLGISHSTVSRRIDELETSIGTRLFDRLPAGFTLTSTGEIVLEHAERVESELLGLERQVIGHDAALSGHIQISLPPPVARHLVMPYLMSFGDLHPDIEIELVPTYAVADLTRREADIAIRFMDEPGDTLVGRRLPDFADAAYATPAYVEAHCFKGANASARWIGWQDTGPFPDWVKRSPFPNCPIHWQIPDILAQTAAAESGLGMAYLPCFVGDTNPSLMRVPPGEIIGARSGWVLTHPDLRATQRVRLCVQHLVDSILTNKELIIGKRPGNA